MHINFNLLQLLTLEKVRPCHNSIMYNTIQVDWTIKCVRWRPLTAAFVDRAAGNPLVYITSLPVCAMMSSILASGAHSLLPSHRQ